MSDNQILDLLQDEMILLAVLGGIAALALLSFILALIGNARAGGAKKRIAELAESISTLQAAERRMSLAMGKDASAKAAVSPPSSPTPASQAASASRSESPRVDTFGPGEGRPNSFATQQGISDLSRYRKKD